MKILTDVIHLLMCQKEHEYDMHNIRTRKTSVCYYYLESDIAEGDTLEDHQEWEEMAQEFKHSLGFSSEEEAMEFIRKAISIVKDIRDTTKDDKMKMDFIMSLLR